MFKTTILLFAVTCSVFLGSTTLASSKLIDCTADTYVSISSSTPQGASGSLLVQTPTDGFFLWMFLKFKITDIPIDKQITMATLELYCQVDDFNGDLKLFLLKDNWSESSLLIGDAINLAQELQTKKSDEVTMGWMEIDITDWVKEWYGGRANNGIKITGDFGMTSSNALFRSREFSQNRPRIRVTYFDCASDPDCDSCEKCQNSTCVPVGCPTCQECNNQHGCRNISDCCLDSSMCGQCHKCEANTCVPVGCTGCTECNDNHSCRDLDCCNDDDCNDGQHCNGMESCFNGNCQPGSPPCSAECCNEASNICNPEPCCCVSDTDCDDGDFCNGEERCLSCNGDCPPCLRECVSGTPPCPSGDCCDEVTENCVSGGSCLTDAHCNNGVYCDGEEQCIGGCCQSGTSPCGTGVCCEDTDMCEDCCTEFCSFNADCDNNIFCDGIEKCIEGCCQDGTAPCSPIVCCENSDTCGPCCGNNSCGNGNCEPQCNESFGNCPIDCTCTDDSHCNSNLCEECDNGTCRSECNDNERCEIRACVPIVGNDSIWEKRIDGQSVGFSLPTPTGTRIRIMAIPANTVCPLNQVDDCFVMSVGREFARWIINPSDGSNINLDISSLTNSVVDFTLKTNVIVNAQTMSSCGTGETCVDGICCIRPAPCGMGCCEPGPSGVCAIIVGLFGFRFVGPVRRARKRKISRSKID